MQIAPSILNADLADLAAEVARVPSADVLHFDVMDNHFVPNLTLGLPVVESLMKHTDKPMDIHLMIEDADIWAPQYAEAGCYSILSSVRKTGQGLGGAVGGAVVGAFGYATLAATAQEAGGNFATWTPQQVQTLHAAQPGIVIATG